MFSNHPCDSVIPTVSVWNLKSVISQGDVFYYSPSRVTSEDTVPGGRTFSCNAQSFPLLVLK